MSDFACSPQPQRNDEEAGSQSGTTPSAHRKNPDDVKRRAASTKTRKPFVVVSCAASGKQKVQTHRPSTH